MDDEVISACAQIAHEANRIYCLTKGDQSQSAWDDAPEWQRKSALQGVRVALGGATPEQQHESWCEDKVADGWTFGETKDPEAKTHPCLMPYANLPAAQRGKDALFIGVVSAMAGALAP